MKMKKFCLYLFAFLVGCCLLCGCASNKVLVDGVEYEALTEEEIDRLCYLAELYLKNNVPNVITPQEAKMLGRMLPVCSIKYHGDRTGRAIVRWDLPQRKIDVVFDGKLLMPSAKCWVQSEDKNTEIIDFTKKGTLQRQQLKVTSPEKQPAYKRSRKSRKI